MAERSNQGARQRGFACAKVTFEENHHPRQQSRHQFFTQDLRCSLVGQFKNGGNIGTMHDQNSTVDYAALKKAIQDAGQALGFAAIGIARADPGEAVGRLRAWLAEGMHGSMDYMARHAELRAKPAELQPGTLSVVSTALDYLPHATTVDDPTRAAISRYAQGRDYHKVVRTRLQKLANAMTDIVGPFGYRVFSDSAPVMEVEFARQAGLGWRGKHSLLLSRRGSWRFLGEIYCDLPLPPDRPIPEHCGTCTACIDACPTSAIVAPYKVDARRCISYLTIELDGPIPEEFRPLIGNRIYGCDDCQLCCPWNHFAQLGDREFAPRHGLDSATLSELFGWTETQFNDRLAGNPIRRIGHERWLRNIAVALGNAPRNSEALFALQQRREHPSAMVREHIAWALNNLESQSS